MAGHLSDASLTQPLEQAAAVRFFSKLLLINVLAACGTPGSESVFVGQKSNAQAADSLAKASATRPAAPRLVTRQYRGHYRRLGPDTLLFQPCGMKVYNVFSDPMGIRMLRDRYRFIAPWHGIRVFSVFTGAIVTDTTAAADSAGGGAPRIRTRFYLANVDSMRAVRPTDCN